MPTSPPELHHQRRALRWLLGWLLWTVIGLSFAGQFYVSSLKAGRPVTWAQALGWSLGDWYVWGLFALPVLALARRFHLDGEQWAKALVLHVCASVTVAFGYLFVRSTLGVWQSHLHGAPASFVEVFGPLLAKTFFFNVVVYWVIVCVGHALDYYRQFRERELRTAELERSLSQARLHTLQMQLNPHFLFNSLNAISALMHRDVEAADRMIARLSDLLRRALDSGHEQEVPLRRELDFLQSYLEIEQTRFGDRLRVRIDAAADTLGALVPNLILQPLVENAIKHGVEPQAKPGEIIITTRRDGELLILEVSDNGKGLAAQWKENIGLANTRSRLQQLYAAQHRLDLCNRDEGGLRITATIPFRAGQAH